MKVMPYLHSSNAVIILEKVSGVSDAAKIKVLLNKVLAFLLDPHTQKTMKNSLDTPFQTLI